MSGNFGLESKLFMATRAIFPTSPDVSHDIDILYREGIVAKKSAFSRDSVEQLREDMMIAFSG
jgi:hypothetical protein